jgi:hypothetical protein
MRSMMDTMNRGSRVIVRTFGGYPRVRRLWSCSEVACVVAEDEAFVRLEDGDTSMAVAVPIEDVFVFSADDANKIDPKQPFTEWDKLQPYRAP